jgi:hypothetical protein
MKPTITDITGIGPAAAAALAEHRLGSLKALARASVEKVSAVPGFSAARAQKVIAAAAELLASTTETTSPDKPAKTRKDKKRKDKKKKDKKKKKNKKDKRKNKK